MGIIGQRARGGVAGMVTVLGGVCFLPGAHALPETEGAPSAEQTAVIQPRVDPQGLPNDGRMGDGCRPEPTPDECKDMNRNCERACNKNACIKEGSACSSCRSCCSREYGRCTSNGRFDFGGCQ